ncbi:origin recognition complex subunit 5 C-terminus-domain-containing protein [Neohortaea acidophila]|uniref:Origin recognition complex subunit 5 C-terminus-domain-containing protein n=1 Tax=Neohortaea acidophila TaxID=245834 RepID=A0A6A6PF99_9PEZI|nr:origin recognition complex subunit 5 C-terminus-domain-containing protein [Neohortaea acidophila]KAF2478625.1 origin recognition complex subunit 5 C-terminus-domain-containing protein [Neohortaea acidophila]
MGLSMLPDELLLTLAEQWPCRDAQLKQLSVLLSPSLPTPSTIIVHGSRATGKSSVVRGYLEASKRTFAFIRCRECITGRHLLERTVAAVVRALQDDGATGTKAYNTRCENLSALVQHLQKLLLGKEEGKKFVLVFDGIDKLRDAPPTLLPALARLREYIPTLQTVLILRHPTPRLLHHPGIPHLHFTPYTRQQTLHILSRNSPAIFPTIPPPRDPSYDAELHEEDKSWLWPRFCAAVWDSLGAAAARDLVSFREACLKLWPAFVAPVVAGEFGTRDFSRLLVSQRRLFQDEGVLLHSILDAGAVTTTTNGVAAAVERKATTHELPYYAKWLLLAAYLASYNPAKLDATYFMKTSERGKKRRAGRPSQKRTISRRLLAPAAFPLDRLFSILHAILPHDLRTSVDVYTLVATLTSLRLLVRSGIGGSGGDVLEPGGKWRVGAAVTWEFVLGLARGVKFEVVDYMAE